MKLSKSLNILSWVYMDLALFILAVIAQYMFVNNTMGTRALQTDMLMFIIGGFLGIISKYVKQYEEKR